MRENLDSLVSALAKSMSSLGDTLLEKRKSRQVGGAWKGSQFKSSADLFAHDFLTNALVKLEPEIPVISEESIDLETTLRPQCYWLIDPIDGTASYAHGFDGFVTQVALIADNVPQLGVIYAPATDECFTAIRGKAAFKNGTPIQPENPISSSTRVIDNYPEPRGIAKTLIEKLAPSEYLESGSLSLKMLRVLEGEADLLAKDVVVRDWDFAAPMAILGELSGIISQVDGKPFDLSGDWEKNGVLVCRDKELYERVCTILE